MKTGMGGWALLVLVPSNADNGGVFSIITKIVTGTRHELGEDAICALCKLRCKLNIGEECWEFQPSARGVKVCRVLCGIMCRPTSQ